MLGQMLLGFESGKGIGFPNSKNAMRRVAVQECRTVFLNIVRGVHSKIYFSHT